MVEQCAEMMQMMGGMMGGGMMRGMMGPMLLVWLLAWLVVIVGIGLLVRLLWGRTKGSPSSPRAILQERFARGELDAEEYQERLSLLQRPQ